MLFNWKRFHATLSICMQCKNMPLISSVHNWHPSYWMAFPPVKREKSWGHGILFHWWLECVAFRGKCHTRNKKFGELNSGISSYLHSKTDFFLIYCICELKPLFIGFSTLKSTVCLMNLAYNVQIRYANIKHFQTLLIITRRCL